MIVSSCIVNEPFLCRALFSFHSHLTAKCKKWMRNNLNPYCYTQECSVDRVLDTGRMIEVAAQRRGLTKRRDLSLKEPASLTRGEFRREPQAKAWAIGGVKCKSRASLQKGETISAATTGRWWTLSLEFLIYSQRILKNLLLHKMCVRRNGGK